MSRAANTGGCSKPPARASTASNKPARADAIGHILTHASCAAIARTNRSHPNRYIGEISIRMSISRSVKRAYENRLVHRVGLGDQDRILAVERREQALQILDLRQVV